MTKEKFSVTGMSCSACSAHVEKSVSALTGVQEVTVNLLTNSMQVEYDETSVSEKDIVKAVKKGGYGAAPDKAEGMRAAAAEEALPESAAALKQMKFRFLFSLCFLIPLMYLSMHHMFWEWFGLPVPSLITRRDLRADSAASAAPHRIRQPEILPERVSLSVPGPPQHGQPDRHRLRRCHSLRHFRSVPHWFRPGSWGSRHGGALLHGSLF